MQRSRKREHQKKGYTMIVFFDKYTEQVEKLRETMRCIGQDVRIAVLENDGFLPAGILSPYEFFTYRDRQETFVEKDLFYNFIELPEFWEVRLLGWMGGIFDMGCEKAKIYFREPVEKRNVQRGKALRGTLKKMRRTVRPLKISGLKRRKCLAFTTR